MAGEVPELSRRSRTRRKRTWRETWRPLGYNIRPRRLHAIARESVARYGGELPSDEETLLSFKGIGAYTAGAVLSFAFGQREAILDTNVARVLFRVFVGAAIRRRTRCGGTCGGVADGPADAARLRLQPGADGFRRDALHRAQAASAPLPDAAPVRLVSVRSVTNQRLIVTAAVIERDDAFLVTRRLHGVHLEGYWEFPGGKCDPGESLDDCLRREIREELDADVIVGAEIYSSRTTTPNASSNCTSSRASWRATRGRCWDRRCGGEARGTTRASVSAGRRRIDREIGQKSSPKGLDSLTMGQP